MLINAVTISHLLTKVLRNTGKGPASKHILSNVRYSNVDENTKIAGLSMEILFFWNFTEHFFVTG